MPADRTNHLVRPTTLVGVLAILGGGLAVLFLYGPRAQPSVEEPSELALSYLRQELAANPRKSDDRLKLARMEWAVGQAAAADATLTPLLRATSPLGRQARDLHLRLAMQTLGAQPPTSPTRDTFLAKARQALEDVIAFDAATFSLATWEAYARQMLALDQPGRAAMLYETLAARDPVHAVDWLVQAARWHEAVGNLEQAAQLLRKASLEAPVREKAVELALAVLAKRQAQGPAALAQAQEEARAMRARFPDSPQVMTATQPLLDALAAAEAKPKGEDARLMALLGKGRIKPALLLLKRMVDERPEDLSRRRWLALVARWNNQPALALEQWFFLAGASEREGLQEALPLARVLYDNRKLAALLVMKGGHHDLAPEEAYELAESYETLGEPLKALEALDRYGQALHQERRYWQLRISLQEGRGAIDDALRELAQMKQAVGLGAEDVVRAIDLLWKNDRAKEALLLARDNHRVASSSDFDFWRQYGDVAFAQGAWEEAADAYRILVKTANAKASPTVFDHLLQLVDNQNQLGELAALATVGYQRFARADWLLWAMQEALAAERWDVLAPLLATAEKDEAHFADEKDYWRTRAAWAEHRGQLEEADNDLVRALGHERGDAETRLELLQSAVATKNLPRLRSRLAAWESELAKNPDASETLSEAKALLRSSATITHIERDHHGVSLQVGPENDKPAAKTQDKVPEKVHEKSSVRADQRRDEDGTLLPAEDRLDMATEEKDHAAMTAILDEQGADIPLGDRIEAEHDLGRNDRAWLALLALEKEARQAGPASPQAELLDKDLADTRQSLLASRGGKAEVSLDWTELGDLRLEESRVRTDIPWRALAGTVGPVARFSLLRPKGELATVASPSHEVFVGAELRRDVALGSTTLRLGVLDTSDKTTPSAHAFQSLRWSQRGELILGGWYHEPTVHSAELREFGFESALSLAVHQQFGEKNHLELEAQGLRFDTHDSNLVAWGMLGRASDAHEWELGHVNFGVRADTEFLLTREATSIPAVLPVANADFPTLLPDRYLWAGAGVTLSNLGQDVGSGVGRPWSLHYAFEGEVGWLWPGDEPLAEITAGLGWVMPHWQELFLRGYYYTSYGGIAGQRYAGVSLGYVLRWM